MRSLPHATVPAGLALLFVPFLAAPAEAQYAGDDVVPHWLDNATSAGAGTVFSGPSFVAALGGGAGDLFTFTKCHGIDQTQGGRHQTGGGFESGQFRVTQGFSGTALDIGLVSFRVSTVDDLTGDACFTPFVPQPATANHSLVAAALIGQPFAPGTLPPATFYGVTFTWSTPVGGSVTLGTDGGATQPPAPLLATLAMEVQGPLNSSPSNVQYYVASVDEEPGADPANPGGLANGNALLATAIFGVDPVTSGAISHTRYAVVSGGSLIAGVPQFGPTPGGSEIYADVAVNTPRTWAIVDGGGDGTGGPDWNISGVGGPVSVVDVRMFDLRSGAQTNPTSADFDPNIVLNRALFVYSATSADSMSQRPFTWDDRFGPPQPGDQALGAQPTYRDPGQKYPVVFDALSTALLGNGGVSFGTPFTPAGGSLAQQDQFQGSAASPLTNGVSQFATPLPVVARPDPSLAGTRIGVSSVGVQLDVSRPGKRLLTEFGSGMTVVLR